MLSKCVGPLINFEGERYAPRIQLPFRITTYFDVTKDGFECDTDDIRRICPLALWGRKYKSLPNLACYDRLSKRLRRERRSSGTRD